MKNNQNIWQVEENGKVIACSVKAYKESLDKIYKKEISERDVDKLYSDSWEQSRQIGHDIRRLMNERNNLSSMGKAELIKTQKENTVKIFKTEIEAKAFSKKHYGNNIKKDITDNKGLSPAINEKITKSKRGKLVKTQDNER